MLLLLACVSAEPDPGDSPLVDSGGGDSGGRDSAPDSSLPGPLQTKLGLCDAWDTQALDADSISAEDGDMDDARALGFGVARAHRPSGGAFSWNIVEASVTGPDGEGADWSLADHVVATAQANSVKLVATLYPNAIQDASTTAVVSSVTAEQMDPWLAFVARTVERYDADGIDDMPGLAPGVPGVETWEIGNEQSCASVTNGCPEAFLDFQSRTYLAAKGASADTRVIVAGAAPVLSPDGTVNAQVENAYRTYFENGGAAYTDAFSFHLNIGAAEPRVGAFLEWWAPLVGDLPVEVGESGTRAPGDFQMVSDDPAIEAAWYVDLLDSAFEGGVARVSWCKTGGATDRAPELWAALHDYAATL